MLKKWHKVVLLVFLVVAMLYFLIDLGLTAYFLTKPHNRLWYNLRLLLVGFVFLSTMPLLFAFFVFKQKKTLAVILGVFTFVYFTLFFAVPDSVYWSNIRSINNYFPIDRFVIKMDTIVLPLLYLFTVFSLYLAIFKLKNQRKRPVKPV